MVANYWSCGYVASLAYSATCHGQGKNSIIARILKRTNLESVKIFSFLNANWFLKFIVVNEKCSQESS